MSTLQNEIDRRRTFAIIAHPDAGKTTLTEKLLLFGGAIQMAGEVKARGAARRAHSDWMKVERERGISVTASVMTFDYNDRTFNLLDTPGHEDFSEDTYRTLSAVDSAVMVLDGAKGIEGQTKKLFEVCRMRDMPIISFVNKLDRESKDPFELIDDVEKTLQIEVVPASWPIGMGRSFLGIYDLLNDKLVLLDKANKNKLSEGITCSGLDDPKLEENLPPEALEKLREDVEMVRALCPEFNMDAYMAGNMTPIYFGSAINNFGVHELLDGVAANAPKPQAMPTKTRPVEPNEKNLAGFVFKIQANMDPKHRDRIAFFRIVSGHYKRGAKVKHIRSGKVISLHNPVQFLAQDRDLAENAFPGDILGIPNHGNLRIGDTLSASDDLRFTGIPSFAPELLQSVRAQDPMKVKHLGRALNQLAEEGAARVFKPQFGTEWIVGVVGSLQFEVLADRIRTEYSIPVRFEPTTLMTARWVACDDARELKKFVDANKTSIATDHTGSPVYLARNQWHLNKGQEDWPKITFLKTKEQEY